MDRSDKRKNLKPHQLQRQFCQNTVCPFLTVLDVFCDLENDLGVKVEVAMAFIYLCYL